VFDLEEPMAGPTRWMFRPGGYAPIAFSSDHRWFYTGAGRGTACVWDVTATDPTKSYLELNRVRDPYSAAFSSDGRWLAEGSQRGEIVMWDLSAAEGTTKSPLSLTGHDSDVNALAFTPDSRTLISSSSGDRTVRIWDLSSQDPSADAILLNENALGLGQLAVSSDGNWLVTAGHPPRIWPLRLAEVESRARRLVGRALTAEERRAFLLRSASLKSP
jgi:WD40 repeat protein